ALLAGSWSKHLHWLPKTALTKWALSLAGGAVVVGYLAEKFAASEGVFLSSSSAGNNEYSNLATSNEEDLLGSSSPDPTPVPPPVLRWDASKKTKRQTSYTQTGRTPLFESMDDEAFQALLNERNIKAEDYQRFKDAVALKALGKLHVPGTLQSVKKRNFYYEAPQKLGYLSKERQQYFIENRYIFDASYYLLADVLKLIKNGALEQFQDLSLVEDGYALYLRPLLVNVAAQMPNILKEACASPGLSHLEFSDCLELYSHGLLEDSSPFDTNSAVEPGNFLDGKYALSDFKTGSSSDPVWMKLTLHSVITSRIEELESAYAADVKSFLPAVIEFHDHMMWFFFEISREDPFTRYSRTRVLQSLSIDPSQYLKDHPREALFNVNIYKNPDFQKNMGDSLKAVDWHAFDMTY
ncbi:MAG: hypothetical protein OXC44_08150, partial [Proteobacteria bacterium]|nr:hypothetical protein [Pseudomonadota bacterium]